MARKVDVGSGFEYGARVLKVSVDALVDIYKATIEVLHEGISVGKADGPVGLMSFKVFCDLLHGGAYAAPINLLPHYAPDPTQSPYYAGKLQNLIPQTWLSWLAQSTAGESATDMMNEVLEDANVPHVLPKLLSDPAYAQINLAFAQVLSADIFLKGTTGLSTLVEGVGKGVAGIEGTGRTGRTTTLTAKQARDLNALLSLVGKKG
jgi:hypothetical protein